MSSIVDALQAVLDDLQEHTPPHHRTPRGIALACWAGLKVRCDQGRARLGSLVPVRAITAMYSALMPTEAMWNELLHGLVCRLDWSIA